MNLQKIVFILILFTLVSSCKVLQKSTKETLVPDEEQVSVVMEEELEDDMFLVPPPPPPETKPDSVLKAKLAMEALYGFLNNDNKIDHKVQLTHSLVFQGKLYCVIGDWYTKSLWVFNGDSTPKKVVGSKDFADMEAQATSELKYGVGMEFANHTMGVISLAAINHKLFFTYSNGRASLRLFQYQETGAKVIDGITDVSNFTTWGDKLVFVAIDDSNTSGLFTVGEQGKPELLLECYADDNNFLIDGMPFGHAHSLPILDTVTFITVNSAPYVVSGSGIYYSFNLPDKMSIDRLAQIEKGVFMTTSQIGDTSIYLRLEEPTQILGSNGLPDYMNGYNPSNLKSINKTVYFNLEGDDGRVKSLFYKNPKVYGDLTDAFAKHDIKVVDLLTAFNGNLIIGKKLELNEGWVYVLQSYNPVTDVLHDVTCNGKPMEFSYDNSTFRYKNNLYFVGSDAENENCLWRYDGMNDPVLIDLVEE